MSVRRSFNKTFDVNVTVGVAVAEQDPCLGGGVSVGMTKNTQVRGKRGQKEDFVTYKKATET